MPVKETINNNLTDEEELHDGYLSPNLIMLRSRGENVQFITKLNLWGLKLKHVSALKCMPNLKIINMSSNCLQSLEPFSNCLNLCELYIRSNQIVNIDEVAHLKYLNMLEKLWLSGNPCCHYFKNYERNENVLCDSSVVYRCTVIRNIQSLMHLDQEVITLEERELSEEHGIFLTAPPPQLIIDEQSQSEISETTLTNINQTDVDESVDTHSVIDITLSSDIEMKKDRYQSDLPVTKKESQINNVDNDIIKDPRSTNDIVQLINNNIDSKSSFVKRKGRNRSYLQDVTLKETNKIRQEYGLKPINKNKISSPAKRLQSIDQKNEKIVRNSIIRLLKTLNYESLERIIQAAEKRILRLAGLTNSSKLQSLLVNGDVVEENDGEWTPNGTYDCSNYMNGDK
uniref:Protein C21orf2 n=2 Tax=Schistosoma mansoni TaxID=6183 RepID=A0A5K4F8G2_SCHMA